MYIFLMVTIASITVHAGSFELAPLDTVHQVKQYDWQNINVACDDIKKIIYCSSPTEFNALINQSHTSSNKNLKKACFAHLTEILTTKKLLENFLALREDERSMYKFCPELAQEIAHHCIMQRPELKHSLLKHVPIKKKFCTATSNESRSYLKHSDKKDVIEIEPPENCPLIAQKIVPSEHRVLYRVACHEQKIKCYSYHLKRKRSLFAFNCCQGTFIFNTQTKKLVWQSKRTHYSDAIQLIVRIAPVEDALYYLENNGMLKKITFGAFDSSALIRKNVKQFDLHQNNRYLIVQYFDNSSEMICLLDDSSYALSTRHSIHFGKSSASNKHGDRLIMPYNGDRWKLRKKWFPLKKYNAEYSDLAEFNKIDEQMHKQLSFTQLALIAYLLDGHKAPRMTESICNTSTLPPEISTIMRKHLTKP